MDNYGECMSYETFMKRAHKTHDNGKPGIHLSNMKNLLDAENNESWVKHLPAAPKQLIKVKGYIDKAFVKLVKSTRKAEIKLLLEQLQQQAAYSTEGTELLKVIRKALDATPVY